jgi:hypothetical protein
VTRYDVMRHWNDGFIAGIGCAGWDAAKNEHWQAGYMAGYGMRTAKSQSLDEYLASTGRKPQDKFRLTGSERKDQT